MNIVDDCAALVRWLLNNGLIRIDTDLAPTGDASLVSPADNTLTPIRFASPTVQEWFERQLAELADET